jgi:hypothetical protein
MLHEHRPAIERIAAASLLMDAALRTPDNLETSQ